MKDSTIILTVMMAYMALLILWGLIQGRKVKSNTDFAIAGRDLPGWVAALSERATGESSWALLGLPGAAYAMGLSEIWTALGCVAGIVTVWAVLSHRLQKAAHDYRAGTFTDFLSKRFTGQQKAIRVVASSTIVFFFFFYVGAQFLGGGKTLKTMFDIPMNTGIVITAIIIIPYTIFGGFRSVVYTDVIQAIVMIITLIAGPIVGLVYLSGHPELYATSIPEALNKAGASYRSLTGGLNGFAAGVVITGGFSWFFGYLGGQPQLSTRFMAIRDKDQARKARNIGIMWTLIAYVGALSLGWIGLAIFGPEGLSDREFVMPRVIMALFPPPLAAVLITGAIAAMISTADSLLVLSATELSENIIKPMRKKALGPKALLRQSRIITALLAVVALLLAFVSPSKLIFTLVSYVWSAIGGTFSAIILLALFKKNFRGLSALLALLAGVSFTIIWISTGMESLITSRILTIFVAGIIALAADFYYYRIKSSTVGRRG